MHTRPPIPLVATTARFSLPLAILGWVILIWAGARTEFHDDNLRFVELLLVLAIALGSAISAMHVVLRGERHWSYLVAFALSAGLIGFWFIMIVLTVPAHPSLSKL
jgi:hypothetical protein